MTTIVNKRTHTPTPNDVYIGRGSKWGNPFKIGAWSREEVIRKYELYIRHTKQHLLNDLHELKGKNLVCYCAPQACHGDVLKELIEELK
jgi:hypothetical protein